jgi:glycosyltransferase involved in cell wall biosynthesis
MPAHTFVSPYDKGMPGPWDATLIVIPAWNEEQSIAAVLTRVFHSLPGVSCLVVDDGSTDGTAAVARAGGARVAQLPFNLGVGGAMRLGFKYALQHDYRAVVQVDADGQHNPEDVPLLVQHLKSADIVIGARFAGVGNYEAAGPRRWAMKLLSVVLSYVARTKLTDTTSGFRASGPKAIAVFAVDYPAEYLGDTVEALVIAARRGCVITQVPVEMSERLAGTPSHNPFKAGIYLGRAGLALALALLRPARSGRRVQL